MRKKTEVRRLSFANAAGKLFIERGFGAVTMEAIAAEAGASKVTLYGYFASKDALFEAFVVEAGRGGLAALEASKQDTDLQQSLLHLGTAYLELVMRPDVVALNRLIIGEAGRQPQLSRIFYENGPKQTLLTICDVLESLMERGLLRRAAPRQTGLYFKSLCEAGMLERQLWGLDPPPDAESRQAAVLSAIEAFLPAYRPASS
ncbi:TetR/AcrR family transcriptional regulator [Xanthomonas sp. CFBP 8703]|jgi:AcrR family transcriptional regulator|uniref:TetR/AcrR family transcriptional regulator n=1 Tax=Xanthomonas bonasiae TaxID=2810351 RepID=A0ABS3AX95_9XANT|nr:MULTISPECIES: TetR/AcrR family transcriptional regulator [Xanthomonas]MBN6100697.1 TetR/AcrR family transcriptional regulator [Xanthomonas bonasiae]NYF18982.1 AcrR family transcriptional regulator [Xanthomonas sp. JAI131]